MKKRVIFLAAVISLMSYNALAQSVSARGSMLARAEAKIAAKAAGQGVGYRIIGAHTNNKVYMTGEWVRKQDNRDDA